MTFLDDATSLRPDLHTAGLVGAATPLSARRDDLAGHVVFMFQPGEEGPGGAVPRPRPSPNSRGSVWRAPDVPAGGRGGAPRSAHPFPGLPHPADPAAQLRDALAVKITLE
ncbi:hypothetical protein RF650_07595 [Kocuria sp. CPCC 205297]